MRAIFLAGFLLLLSLSHSNTSHKTLTGQTFLKQAENAPYVLTIDTLYAYVKELGILFPEIVVKQAILETGCLSSVVYRENNNLFGMKKPVIRETVALKKSNRGYACYKDWKDSVLDYKYWQEFNRKGETITDYYQFLINKKYSTSNSYRSKLKKVSLKCR